jgi:uncharacterized protein with gpF-like domain
MRDPAVLAARPYWMITGVNDARTRPTHRKVHGDVILASDPVFDEKPLPWGHNCRCRFRSLSLADVKRLGLRVTTGAALHALPDPGWAA